MGADRAGGVAGARRVLLPLCLAAFLFGSASVRAQTSDEIRSVLAASRAGRDVERFYELHGFRPAWFEAGVPRPTYYQLAEAAAEAYAHGLDPKDYALPAANQRNAAADVRTTEAALRLARHILEGRVDPRSVVFGWTLESRKADLPALLAADVDDGSIDRLFHTLEPPHEAYGRLKRALSEYRRLESSGGWSAIPNGEILERGDTSAAVAALRRRLHVTGDFADSTPQRSDVFDSPLERAVRAFQERHGLDVDGVVGGQTRAALNVPVQTRIAELALNMERWRWLPAHLGARRLEINIAGFLLRVYEADEVRMAMKVIVGKPTTRTPVFSTTIREVILAPYWTVPRSIEVNEILPKLRRDPNYLARHHMQRLANGFLRQEPGPTNPLGRVKFTIPNAFGVGLHDTPERQLFGRATCAFSHGCIRLERPEDLAVYLLKDADWSRERITETIETWRETKIMLVEPVPLHVLYWTAWVEDDGRIQFRSDIYGYDDRLEKALASE